MSRREFLLGGSPCNAEERSSRGRRGRIPTFDLHVSSIPLNAGYHVLFDYLLRYELTGPNNWSSFNDPEIDKLMAQADGTLDAKASAAFFGKVLARVQEQAYLAEGYNLPFNYVVNSKVEGLTVEFGTPDFTGVWLRR